MRDSGDWGERRAQKRHAQSGCPGGALGSCSGGEHQPGVAGSSEFTGSTRRYGFNMWDVPQQLKTPGLKSQGMTVTSLYAVTMKG